MQKILLRPADIVFITYALVVCALLALIAPTHPLAPRLIVVHLTVAAGIFMIGWLRPPRLRSWYPVLAIGLLYSQLRYVVPILHPQDLDLALAAIDKRLFSVYPTVWFERFTYPLVTELLQICYATYYFLPIALGLSLWLKHELETLQRFMLVLALGFTLSYIGYILVPAIGPRYTPMLMQLQTKPLTGVFLFSHIRDWLDIGEGITRDCFPSGHTEITLLVLFFAYRFKRRMLLWMAPLGTAIIISTVYLRYHHVIDVLAGSALAVCVYAVSPSLWRVLWREPGFAHAQPQTQSAGA